MISFQNFEHAQTLAEAVVNTIPEPFVVLDGELRVLAASRSFYESLTHNVYDGYQAVARRRVMS